MFFYQFFIFLYICATGTRIMARININSNPNKRGKLLATNYSNEKNMSVAQ